MRNSRIIVNYKKVGKYGRVYRVQIDDREIEENNKLDGCRNKYVKDNIIVKTEDTVDYYRSQCSAELQLYKKLRPRDRKHFPKLIAGNHSYIAQEFIKLKSPRKAPKEIKAIVRELVARYNISDVGVGRYNWNWGICAKTGIPIIYDFGFTKN